MNKNNVSARVNGHMKSVRSESNQFEGTLVEITLISRLEHACVQSIFTKDVKFKLIWSARYDYQKENFTKVRHKEDEGILSEDQSNFIS